MKFKVRSTSGDVFPGGQEIDINTLGELIEFITKYGGLVVIEAGVGSIASLEIYDDYRE